MHYTREQAIERSLEYFDGDELAANVFVGKYALQDNDGNYLEATPTQMHSRLAREFARIEQKYPNPLNRSEIFDLLDNFDHIIPQGSPMSGIGNDFKLQSVSNCFVIDSPHDSYAGILKTDQEQVQIMKRRGGVGFDVSRIRPKGMITTNAAKTTDGIEVFLDRFSNSCREVAQNGRRGALMLSISVHHPQILDFIRIKQDLKRVTGANISVRVTDRFMTAVKNDDNYIQQWPIDENLKEDQLPEVVNITSAREVFDALVLAAHQSAEPGFLCWDTALRRTPSDIYAKYGFRSISTNPCGEIVLSAYDSCRLMVVNLVTFVENKWAEDAFFNYEVFHDIVRNAQRLMDDMIDIELEQIDKILAKIDSDPEPDDVKFYEINLWHKIKKAALDGRRTGLGITGLGDAIAMLGQQYGSDESIVIVEKIYKELAIASYTESIVLAKERGAFRVFDRELERGHEFLEQIFAELPPEIMSMYEETGRRNIANLTTAPVGSVSCLTQTTAGMEPLFMISFLRWKKINLDDTDVTVHRVDEMGDEWTKFDVMHKCFKDWLDWWDADYFDNETDLAHAMCFSPYYMATAEEIDYRAKVRLQAAAQKWVCHAISNTTNLPEDVTVETVKELYMLAWETGCKGLTVYRSGSRAGVLTADDKTVEGKDSFKERHAPKRPESVECDIHRTSVKGEKWIVLVGLYDGKPYEVIGGLDEKVNIPAKFKTGKIKKRDFKSINSKYDLILGDDNEPFIIHDIVNIFANANYAGHTRTISLGLRHGAPVQYMVEQLQKDKEMDMFSFSKSISRCLKKYIVDGTTTGKTCSDCGTEDSLVYQEGCVTCASCGASRCS